MNYSEAIEKIEKVLSDSGFPLLNIDGCRIMTLTADEDIPSGDYLVADFRIAIPISQYGTPR